MKRSDRNKAYDVAISTTGRMMQIGLAIEEMSELIKELIKEGIRGKKNNIPQITEEIADFQVMLETLKRLYNISDMAIAKVMDVKIKYMLDKMKRIQNGEDVTTFSSHDFINKEAQNKTTEKTR